MENIEHKKLKPNLSNNRILSIDIFRGATIVGMILVNNPGNYKYIYSQLRHSSWHGCTFTDLIFPFFLFIVGVSIFFAFTKVLDKGIPRSKLYSKIIRRTIILFAIGLFLNAFPKFDIANIRIMGVLQRIAICYFFVSIIFLHTKLRGQIVWTIALLFFYWGLMEWIPVPGIGAGYFEKNANFATYFDSFILTGFMGYFEKFGDPEGIFSTIPALSTTLFGVLTGHLLKTNKTKIQKTFLLFLPGILLIIIGIIWGFVFPINKHLWTSSYVVLTAGWALVSYALFYFVIDAKGHHKIFQPFVVFGMNAITVYGLSIIGARLIKLMDFTTACGTNYHLRSWLCLEVFDPLIGNYNSSLAYALVYILFWYGMMLILYKRKIFIKI